MASSRGMDEKPAGLIEDERTGDLAWESGAYCAAYLHGLPDIAFADAKAAYDRRVAKAIESDIADKAKRRQRLQRQRQVAALQKALSVDLGATVHVFLSRSDAKALLEGIEARSMRAFDAQVADALKGDA